MNNNTINIGILDDDRAKITSIKGLLQYDYTAEASCEAQEKEHRKRLGEQYNGYNLNFIEIPLNEETSVDTIIAQVLSDEIDCLIIDYKLNSRALTTLNNGVYLAKNILLTLQDFPLFVITSYEEELNQQEIFQPIQTVDFYALSAVEGYAPIIKGKLIETVKSYSKLKQHIEEELKALLKIPYEKRDAQIDSKILELDSKLEHIVCGESVIPKKIKEELSEDRVGILLSKLDEIIEKYDKNGK